MKQPQFLQRLAARLPLIVLILCLIQPCMDVLSYWLNWAGFSNSITLLLRLFVLFIMILLGFSLSERRRYYYLTAGILLIYTVCHMLYCRKDGYLDPMADLTNLIRIYQLPLTTLAFITFLRREPKCLEAIKRGFFLCLLVIIAVEILSVVTGTNPYTYPNKSVGILGWFYFANAQSAILSMLVPVSIGFVMEKKKYNPAFTFGVALVSFGVLYFFATRLAYAALLGTGLGLAVSLLILKKTQKVPSGRAALAILLCTVLALGFYFQSPMYKNNQMVAGNEALKQEDINTMVAADAASAESAGLEGAEREIASLRSAYKKYLPGPMSRFGLERTAEVYHNSTKASVICDVRLQKLNYCRMILEDDPSSRFFGLELAEMTYAGQTYDVENDFHGIYYLCGIAGLGLLALFLLWFLGRIGIALIRNFKKYFTLEAASFGISLICCLAHAYFTAGVLRRPNTTFYLALVLAAVYALTRTDSQSAD